MKTRTIKELLELMLGHQNLFQTGLCSWASYLYSYSVISLKESHSLRNYIKSNKPDEFSSFDTFKQNITYSGYYWKMGEIQPRIVWINKQIKKLT